MKHFDIIKMKYCRQFFFFFCQLMEVLVILTFHPGQGILSLYVSSRDEKSFIAHF